MKWMLMRYSLIGLIAATAVACGGDPAEPTMRTDVMWELSVFPRAVSVPVNDTLRIIAKPLDHDGNVIDNDVEMTFTSEDTSRVRIDSTGLVTATRSTVGGAVWVTVVVRAGPVTKQQRILVGVTDGPVDVDSLSLEPLFGEPVVSVGSLGMGQARLFDSHGNAVANVYPLVEIVDVSAAFFPFPSNNGSLTFFAVAMGKALFRTTLLVNGKLLSDSLEYRTGYRTYVDFTTSRNKSGSLSAKFASTFNENIYIAPNAQVEFVNNLTTPMDVVFERPDDAKGSSAGAAGGSITALQPNNRISRWFPSVGDHFFTVQSGTDSKRVSVTVKE